MQLDSNDFELFGLEPRFEQDRAAIDARWRALQTEVHPDRFAAQGAAAQRVAMQWAVRVNEAYQHLKDPLRRATLLCEMRGAPVNAESNTRMPTAFLMQQMEWREALDDARTLSAVEALAAQVAAHRREALVALGATLDAPDGEVGQAAEQAAEQVRALMFVERFAQDVDARLEALEQ